jgi:FtsP/CotA-like multicopper oxidase with cupredoxin domain
MFNRKFLNVLLSILVIASQLSGGVAPVLASTPETTSQPAPQAAGTSAPTNPTDESRIPHYFGPFPNWANSPQVLTNAVVAISPAAPVPGSVGNALIDRAYATDFSAPVVPASLAALTTRLYTAQIGSATGGTFTLTVGAVTTAPIAYNASAATVEGALTTAGLTATVSGSGSSATPWLLTFSSAPASVTLNGAALTQAVTDSALTSTVDPLVFNLTSGSATGGTFVLTLNGTPTAALAYNLLAADLQTALGATTVTGTGTVADPWVITFGTAPTTFTLDGALLTKGVTDASAAAAATDQYSLSLGTALGGTFTLMVNAATTAAIAYNALAADVQAALSTAGVTATVTGSGTVATPWVLTFASAPTTVTLNDSLTQPTIPSLYPALVVVPTALPSGTLQAFKTWNQASAGSSLTPSAGKTFHAYLLRPTATTNQYQVVYDSGLLTVPALTTPGVSELATFTVTPAQTVISGDLIAFYGAGVPNDRSTGTDTYSYLAPAAPVQGNTLTLGDAPTFPLTGQARTYSFAATVLPAVAGSGAEAIASVNTLTGGIQKVTVTVPGSGYTSAPTVSITAPGVTLSDPAVATASISTGSISGMTVDMAGYGFTAPIVTITGGSPTTAAVAVASGGVDDIVTIDNPGSGYTQNATVKFGLPDRPGGIQATGSLVVSVPDGLVTGIVVTNPGSGYSTAPTVTITDLTSGAPTSPAAATATISIGQIEMTNAGAGYKSAPTVTVTDSVGLADKGASVTPNLAVFGAVTGITVTHAGTGYLTPGIRKFVDTLPGLTPAGANNLGQYIPVAVPDITTYPGSDYYEIAVVQYRMKFHTDLPATLLRGYVQLDTSVIPGTGVALSNANLDGTSTPIVGYRGVDNPHYLGPTIIATKDRPVRILFRNLLPTGTGGNLFLPVDTTLMGAGPGPDRMALDAGGVPMDMATDAGSVLDGVRNPACGETPKPADCYSENRATLHLHGGITPWISDGTPHQWTTPAGEGTTYPKGVSVSNVPDMPDPGPGAMTFFYTNQQSARLMFYHDHAWGITRLNVYAGEAAGYLIQDATEKKLFGTGAPFADLGTGTPLIIQDKTFVPSAARMAQLDPTWQANRWGGEGNLWAPHVYMPAQNPGDPSGMSAFGRWMYGPWFWPPAKTAKYQPIKNPYYNPSCNLNDPATWQYQSDPFCEPALIPGTTNVSVGMEAFNDTPIVNGTAYPKTTLKPQAYRFRILNAANDRFWNLSWYVADSRTGTLSEVALNPQELAAAQTDPNIVPTPDTAWSPAGPSWIHIGSEGGFLPAPVIVPPHPTTWITDPTRFDVGNVDQHSLMLAPAERADVIVDFSQFRGKTLILYNDAPAAYPARVASYDYYTGGPDLSPAGAPSTLPGYGPNTRTIMKVTISMDAPAVAFDRPNTTNDRLGTLTTAFAHHTDGTGVFESGQNPIIVGQAAYNSAYGSNFVGSGWCSSPTTPTARCDGMARIQEGSQPGDKLKFDTLGPNKDGTGPQLQIPFEPKAIHDEMNSANFDEFGRMTANLGLEAPGATPLTQNIILYPYVNPATEILDATGQPSSLNVTPISSAADGTQIWKITHNGVDTHPIHFHLYDVQILNRVTWDNIIIPTEPSELGWKDTIRVSPLQDTIVALRPIVPVLPFAVPDSKRPLNPMMPIGAHGAQAGPLGIEAGFNNTDAAGNPIAPIINVVTDFGWEYVFHCHILSHEEMDMMRPVTVHVARTKADAPVLSFTRGTSIQLTWTDGTLVDYLNPVTWGSAKNEIGYRIERAEVVGGVTGAYAQVGTALANQTIFADTTALPGVLYSYRVVAFNAAGDSVSNSVVPPLPLGAGTYDDRDPGIMYGANWLQQTVTGNFNNTETYSNTIGNSATINFTGTGIRLLFRTTPGLGTLNASIDGGAPVSVNQNSVGWLQLQGWDSPTLTFGDHTLTITHSSGAYAVLDAVTVKGQPLAVGTYDNTDSALVYSSGWVQQAMPGNYNNTESYSAIVGSSVSFTIDGTGLKLMFRTSPDLGVLNVSIDGGTPIAVNQQTPGYLYQQTWDSSGLLPGIHTVTLTHASGAYVLLDAVTVRPPVPMGTYDDTDPNIYYSAAWVQQAMPGNVNNTEHYSASVGNVASLTFHGAGIRLAFRTTPDLGVLNVAIDGGAPAAVNQYSAGWLQNQTWDSPVLAVGDHTLTLTHASGAYVVLDAVTVKGLPLAVGTFDDRDTNIIYDAAWIQQPLVGNYLSTETYSAMVGLSGNFTFHGSGIRLVFRTTPDLGVLNVSIDGGVPVAVNQYSAGYFVQQGWDSPVLTNGDHTVTFTHASGAYVVLDGIVVRDIPLVAGTYDDNNPKIYYATSWVQQALPGNYGNTETYSPVIGSNSSLTFFGSGIRLTFRTTPDLGVINVSIDGGAPIPVSQYSAGYLSQQVWDSPVLTAGNHTVTIAHASGAYIVLDAVTIQ